MKKYILVAQNTLNEMLMYRLNFAMWRLRVVLQLLSVYFLWYSIIPAQQVIFGYSHSLILTYILGTSFLSSIILSTRTHEIGENISSGDLSTFLVKPFNYFLYWFARDMGDKLFNIGFSIVELTLLYMLLKPPLYLQTNGMYIGFFIIAIIIAVFLYFFIGCILGLIGFWSREVWAPRFIFYILITFFAGALFPLDIFPKLIYNIFQLLPFTYLLYFPLKIYLGQLSMMQMIGGLGIGICWIGILYISLQKIWIKGLRLYAAEGR